MPKARPTRATWVPIRPSPSNPRRRPCRSVPTVLCHGPPSRSAVFSGTTWRASPRISAQVSSVVGSGAPPVPHTVTPWWAAASRSTDALRIPVVTSSFSRGSRANSDAGKGVRSRMMTTISQSPIASATASSPAMCSWNGTTSTASSTPDQSAADSATS